MLKKLVFIILNFLVLHSITFAADFTDISVLPNGEKANDESHTRTTSMSAEGRFVVYESIASNLVENDTNFHNDIFVYDLQTSVTERVSVSSSGAQSINGSNDPSISANGRYVAFISEGPDLVADDVNQETDVLVHDRQTGITERISKNSNGIQADSYSTNPDISGNGRYIAFTSYASNMMSADNFFGNVFVHDRETGVTEVVSKSSSGMPAEYGANYPQISADGRFIAFYSSSDDLVPDDTNQSGDVFVHDRQTGTTELVSVSSTGIQGNDISGVMLSSTALEISISDDGRFVVFTSSATNFYDNDTNSNNDIFVRDRQAGTTEIVSVSSDGVQGNLSSESPSISADGRYVLFTSISNNLVTDNTSDHTNVYIRDRQSGTTHLVSTPSLWAPDSGAAYQGSISADGTTVVLTSFAVDAQGSTIDYNHIVVAENLVNFPANLISVEKKINNSVRNTKADKAQLTTGTQYRQVYRVTNNSSNRLYQVQVFENGNLVCNFFSLNPGETKQRCSSYQIVLNDDQHAEVSVTAKVSGSSDTLTNTTNAYYYGWSFAVSSLSVTHRINGVNADTPDQAPTLDNPLGEVLFKVENTGEIELYRVKAYHDPVGPVNNGWEELCVIGILKPGQVRYCKRDKTFTNSGLNHAVGRAQGSNAIINPTAIVNWNNPTYFMVP